MAALGDVLALSGARTNNEQEYRVVVVELPATVDNADTFTLDMGKYGCSRLTAILGQEHSTDGQVVITQAPTTTVSAGTVTVTVGGSNANLVRSFVLWMR